MTISNLEENLQHAKDAIKYVRSFLIYGSNTEKDSLRPDWQPERLPIMRQEVLVLATIHAMQNGGVAEFPVISKLTKKALKKFQFGHCGEQAQAAFVFLDKKGVYPLDFCMTNIGGHNLVVIGRKSKSNPEDISTWGSSAVVCDPWAEKAYPLSDFLEMQKPEHDVRYADIYYNPASFPPPYLGGTLVSQFRKEPVESLTEKKHFTHEHVQLSIFNERKNQQTEASPPISSTDKKDKPACYACTIL